MRAAAGREIDVLQTQMTRWPSRLVSLHGSLMAVVWDRYAPRYSWAMCAITFPLLLQIFLLLSFVVVAYENSDRYVEVAAATVVGVLVMVYATFLPGLGGMRRVEQWAAGHEVGRDEALQATYTWAPRMIVRAVVVNAVCAAFMTVVVGAIAGATGWRLVQYGMLGGVVGIANMLVAMHSAVESALRPTRVAIVGDTVIGDSLPALARLSLRGRTWPFSRSRSIFAFQAHCWRRWSIASVKSRCFPSLSRLG